ncbi:MAG: hypothetical protein K8R25_14650, partial [Methanosarcinales archaeon]|nr:hypothetical protein [Methanosarcinales archaeon]
MNKNKNYLFAIGMVLTVLMVFAAPAAADNVIYFDPDPSCVAPGESIVVTMYVNASDPVQNWQDDIYFDPTVVNITGYTCGEFPLGCQMSHWGDHVRRGGVTGDGTNLEPGIHELGNLTLEGISQGTSTLEHQGNVIGNWYGQPLPDQVWIDGTFNSPCGGPEEPDLIVTEKSEEWISLEEGTYNVTYTVANIGTSDADASTTSIEIDETVVTTDSVPALATGDSYTSTLGPFTLSGENDTINVCADSDETISELDETNNCLSNVLERSGLPDLTVTEKSEEWISLEEGTYNVTYTVANIGTSDADASTTSIEIDETVVTTDSVPALATGDSYTSTLGPFTLS